MHVITDCPQIAVAAAVHDECLVTSAEQVAKEFMAAIKPRSVGAQEPFHPRDKIGIGRLDDEMKMIFHETIRMNLPISFLADLGKCDEEAFVIQVIAENRLTTVTKIHDVIDCAGIFSVRNARGMSKPYRTAALV